MPRLRAALQPRRGELRVDLGKEAVEAFNALSADPAYATLPAVLVAGETQTAVDAMARVDALRRVTRLPIRKREFAGLLEELLGGPRKPDPA